MTKNNQITPLWVEGKLSLAGLDNRMMELLKAVQQSGSLNQAAKQVGLSYKGAWQIIERANNSSPKTLVITATGGAKGGGTTLTKAGKSLITLFDDLEQQHQIFLNKLNQTLADDIDMVLLFQRLVVKTSAKNQLFGEITAINKGEITDTVHVKLKNDERITTTISHVAVDELNVKVGAEAILLINSADISLISFEDSTQFSARNRLLGRVICIQQNEVDAQITLLLSGGETIVATMLQSSVQSLNLKIKSQVFAIFKTNAPILGIRNT